MSGMIGRTLGQYRIIEQIGLGGMAVVYKAYDPGVDRHVAVKILPEHFSQDPLLRQRFKREAQAAARLEHLHILPIFAYGDDGGIAYLAMRLLTHGTLTDRIKQGALPLPEASRLLTQMAGALDYAHQHGIIHRDVKPSNVMLDEHDNVYLTDFGIAKVFDATQQLTGDHILGTPAYMSPEQWQGQELTGVSDIYSLGIILYEMVTGRRPFHAETPVAVMYQHLNDPLPPPDSLRPNLPEAAANVIYKALAKEPKNRYRSAASMAEAFTAAVAGVQELFVGPPAPLAQTKTEVIAAPKPVAPVRLRPWLALGLLFIVLVVLGGAYLAGWFGAAGDGDNTPESVAARPMCPAGAEELFFDDFEDGIVDDWTFSGSPWPVATDTEGNQVLLGEGHYHAIVSRRDWRNIAYSVDVRAPDIDAANLGVHIILSGSNGRYYANWPHGLLLRDQMDPPQPDVVLVNWEADTVWDGEWHTVMMSYLDGQVNLFFDGAQVAAYLDPDPLLINAIELENHNAPLWYDNVLVCRQR